MQRIGTILGLFAIAAIGLRAADKGGTVGPRDAPPTAQERLVREVRHQLLLLPFYGVFDDLAYRVDGGTVTLFGYVTRPTLRTDAAHAVEKIEGVTGVVNKIELLPLSPMDDRIRMATYRAIYGYTGLDRYALRAVPPIHIIVKNGYVTLTGTVANQGDKNIAGMRARGVPGVFQVTNNLEVEKRG